MGPTHVHRDMAPRCGFIVYVNLTNVTGCASISLFRASLLGDQSRGPLQRGSFTTRELHSY